MFAGYRFALRRQGRADCDQIGRALGAQNLIRRETQRFRETPPKFGQKMQRSAQQRHFAPDGPSLRQAADGLVDDRLQDRGSDIFFRYSVIHQSLHVGFGEHTAPGGDGVDGPAVFGHFVQAGRISVQQGRHVVDERAGAAGADSVHALFHRRTEVGDLGVLAAQFDRRVGVGNQVADGGGGSDHFLDEGEAERLGDADAGGPGHDDRQQFLPQDFLRLGRHVLKRRGDIRKMPCVLLKNDPAVFVQYHHFDGGRTDVDSHTQGCAHIEPSCFRRMYS